MGANESSEQTTGPARSPFPPPNFLLRPTKLNDPFGDTERLDYAPPPLHQLQTRTLLLRLLPPEIVLDILDLAHYYHRETAFSTQEMVVTQNRRVYTSASVAKRGRLEEVRFGMNSHDQGWSDTMRENKGTYKASSSFFDAVVLKGASSSAGTLAVPTQVHRETLQYNRNAVASYKIHLVTFERDRARPFTNTADPLPSPPSLVTIAVETAKQTKTFIALVAIAQFPGWQNHVAAGRIDLYYSYFYPPSEDEGPEGR